MNTDTYFENLADYLLNQNLTEGSEFRYEPVKKVISTNQSFYDNIKEILGTSGYMINGWLQIKNQNNNLNELIIYGGYAVQATSSDVLDKGFVIILDNKMNVIKSFLKYSSGTDLAEIISLNQDTSDNTFYGIERRTGAEGYRFIMLNNFAYSNSSEESNLILRISYNMPAPFNVNNMSVFNRVIKDENSATYSWVGVVSSDLKTLYLETFKINVGAENEWNSYNVTESFNVSRILNFIGIWADEKLQAQIAIQGSNDNEYTFYNQNFQTDKFDRYSSTPCDGRPVNAHYISFDRILFICEGINETTTSQLITYYTTREFHNKIYQRIKENTFQEVFTSYLVENTLYILSYRYDTISGNKGWRPWLRVTDFEIKENGDFISWTSSKTITNDFTGIPFYNGFILPSFQMINYNLVTFLISTGFIGIDKGGKNLIAYTTYNSNNYNGKEYFGKTGLVPNSSILYEKYNNEYVPALARNVYNKTVNDNITTSTIQIPNLLLNNQSIDRQDLISLTNNIINQNNNPITKNIYETLNINFITTLLIENRNNRLNSIINQNASNILNRNISNENQDNYNNIYMPKVIVKYDDGTTFEVQFATLTFGDELNQMHNENVKVAYISFTVDFYKKVNEIDFVSNDNTVTYAIIDTSNYEYGNDIIYTFNQKINFQKWEDLNEEA